MKASACRGLATATLTLLGLISAAALPLHAQTADDIYAKAKAEGAFVLYVGGPTGPWEATARIFGALPRHQGVGHRRLQQRARQEDRSADQGRKLEVDTAIFQTLQDFVRWKADGRLMKYKPSGFDTIDESFKDADGAYYGVKVIAMPYMTTPRRSAKPTCRTPRSIS